MIARPGKTANHQATRNLQPDHRDDRNQPHQDPVERAMQAQLRAVGIDLQIQKMERGPYLDFTRDHKHNLNASASTNIDPDGILRVSYHSSNKPRSNFSGVADAQLDALLDRGATQEIGSTERRKTYEDAQMRLMDPAPFVSVMSQVRVEGMAARVRGLHMSADGLNAQPLSDVWVAS
jgi:peptide/nickel transport system substrate-binding protein